MKNIIYIYVSHKTLGLDQPSKRELHRAFWVRCNSSILRRNNVVLYIGVGYHDGIKYNQSNYRERESKKFGSN